MKTIILFLPFLLISIVSKAQKNNYIGNYEKEIKAITGEIFQYKLEINADSTFTFHYFRNIGQPQSINENSYGKGTWKIIKNIIHFYTDAENDINTKYQLNFTNSKGRFDHKDKKLFRFYHSDIRWIEKLTILKID